MQNTDKQINEIIKRSDNIRRRNSIRRVIAANVSVMVLCICGMVAAIMYFPDSMPEKISGAQVRYGSLILTNPGMGYIVVGFLAFVLGICVALVCVNIRKLNHKE